MVVMTGTRPPPTHTGKFVLCVDLHGLGLRDLNPTTATTAVGYILNHFPGAIGQVGRLSLGLAWRGLAWLDVPCLTWLGLTYYGLAGADRGQWLRA